MIQQFDMSCFVNIHRTLSLLKKIKIEEWIKKWEQRRMWDMLRVEVGVETVAAL